METMIEKVAKALCATAGHNPDAPNPDKGGEPFWYSDRPYARAAIEAMREPSDGMLIAALEAVAADTKDRLSRLPRSEEFTAIVVLGDGRIYSCSHRAMIDAALNEAQSQKVGG